MEKIEIKRIIEDDRKILAIHAAGDHQTSDYKVGQHGVTEILPYEEKGEYDFITFMAILRDDKIIARLPATNLHIHYEY